MLRVEFDCGSTVRARDFGAFQQMNNMRVLRFQNLKVTAPPITVDPARHEQQREHRQQNWHVDFDNDLAWAAPAKFAPV